MGVCTASPGLALGRWLLSFALVAFASTAILTTPAVAYAQEGEQPVEEKKEGEEGKTRLSANPIVHFFVSIGVVFGIIFAALSVGTLALIIILVMDLRMGEAVSPAFVDEFTGLVNKRQFKQAYEMCKNDNSFLGRVLTAGMGRLQYGIEDAREAMSSMVETVKASKDSMISYLANVGTLGPMLGLVGTVSGMVGAFRRLGAAQKAPDASELAGEISHALVVTLVGVAVAVPAIFFYSYFKNRLTAIANNTANLADDLLTQMYHNSKKAGPAPTTTAAATAATAPERTQTAVQEKK
ncbi:MAG: MotA/TolQ/ExbB proton channel family protein [Gemmataceae bacterium]|nr:MotA/TolQ/ExbB proton channel family protein [Gemmataceae bacterium]